MFHRRLLTCIIVLALAVSVFLISLSQTTTADAKHIKFVGYLTSWSGTVSAMQLSKLTHVNYAFVIPNADGSIGAVPDPGKLQSLVSAAHAQGVKVLISVGGWNDGNDSGFENFSKTAGGRTNFTNAMINLVNTYNLDGVDIDWEYPDPDNSFPDNPQPGSSAHNYYLMMQDLSNAMHSRGKLLTGAIVALGWAGKGIPTSVFPLVDFYNLMAYDGGDGPLHSPYQFALDSVNYWRGRGLPASKTVLGVPFYGRPSWASYATLLAAGCSPDSDTCNYNGSTVYYNGRPTMRQKTTLGMQNGGIMYWEDSQDTTNANSLVSAIYSHMHGGVVPTNPPATNPPGATATRTNTPGTGTGCFTAYVHGNVYTGGMTVSYNGRNWRAKWWTQNEAPSTGGSGVWEDLGACGGGTVPTNTPAAPTATRTRTNTPVGPTATRTNTLVGPTATRTRTNTPAPATVTRVPTRTNTPSTGTPAWAPNTAYAVGAVVSYGGRNYRCLQAHTSLVGWEPPNVPALWAAQ